MSLKHAILGILTLGPSSGYDLSKFMDLSISFIWNANHSQIYLELKKLKKAKLVESRIKYQVSKPNKEIYTITEGGRDELKRWLMQSSEKTVLKDSFLLRSFFMNHLSGEDAILKFTEQTELQKNMLSELKEIKALLKSYTDLDLKQIKKDTFFQSLVVNLGVELTKTYVKWLEKSVKEIKKAESMFEPEN